MSTPLPEDSTAVSVTAVKGLATQVGRWLSSRISISDRPINLIDEVPRGFGSTDDATAYISAALTKSAGPVEWPEGLALTLSGAPIDVPAGKVLRLGQGAQAIVRHAGAGFQVWGAIEGGDIYRPVNGTTIADVAVWVMPGSSAARVSGVKASGGHLSGVAIGGTYADPAATNSIIESLYVPDCRQFGIRVDNSVSPTIRDAVITGAELDCIKIRMLCTDPRIIGGTLSGARGGDGIDGFAGISGGYIGGGLKIEGTSQSGLVIKTDNATDSTPLEQYLTENGLPQQTIVQGVIIRSVGGTGMALHRTDSNDSDVTAGVELPWLSDVQVSGVLIDEPAGNGMFINGYGINVSQATILRSKSEAVRVHQNSKYTRLHQVVARAAGWNNPSTTVDGFVLLGREVYLNQCAAYGQVGRFWNDSSESAATKITRFGFISASGTGAVAGYGATHHFAQCHSSGHKTGAIAGEAVSKATHVDCTYEGYASRNSWGDASGGWLRISSAGVFERSANGVNGWTTVG